MVRNLNLEATAFLIIITSIILLLVYIFKKKKIEKYDANIFECGENAIGSAMRQYRVEHIFNIIKDGGLIILIIVQSYWIYELITTDSLTSFVGSVATNLVWIISYLYCLSVETRETI